MAGDNDLLVDGKQVDYIFFPGEPLVVSHGKYCFENRTSKIKVCTINSCHFLINENAVPIHVFSIYTGDRLIDKVLPIPPASRLEIRVTIPFTEVRIGFKFTYGVRLNLECDGIQYDVTSNLNIIQEKTYTD